MTYTLGIDIGTFESKGVLTDAEGGIVASAARPHKMLVPQPGWAEHRAREDWWGDFCFLSNKLITDSGIAPKDIRAVGASAIGPCMLPVDKAGEPLMNAVLYGVDTRAAAEIAELTAEIGEAALLERCGNALTSQSVGPKILWLKRNRPDIFRTAHKIVGATTYLVQQLTGACVVDHYSASSSSPLYDVNALAWSDALCPGLIDADRLPELAWTTDIAATVTPSAAEATGLAPGTAVIAGTIDAAAEAISVGVASPGDMMLMYGSTMFMILVTRARARDPRLWYAPWLFPGQHASMAGLATSGTLTHWFREHFARELAPATALSVLTAEAEASPPGAKGLILLPYFSGERTPIHDPHAKGVLFGLDLTHQRGDVYRALLEGIAYGTHHVIETFSDAGHSPISIQAVGGGTKNRVWSQAISDVSGHTQLVRQKTTGAAYGDAFLAALAIGAARPADIVDWNPVVAKIAADPAVARTYHHGFARYRALYAATRALMHDAAAQSLAQGA
jgi:xylulokinase